MCRKGRAEGWMTYKVEWMRGNGGSRNLRQRVMGSGSSSNRTQLTVIGFLTASHILNIHIRDKHKLTN